MLKALHKLFGGRSGAIETAPSARVLPLKDVEDEEILDTRLSPRACQWPH
jgi:conjugal transfer pilus assembly protein TraI